MELFAIEIRTASWQPMILWYTTALKMKAAIRSETDGYALLVGEGNWRIALLQKIDDDPRDYAAISMAIEVEDLHATRERIVKYLNEPIEDISSSDEEFLQWTVQDPDGNRVKLFQFVQPTEN